MKEMHESGLYKMTDLNVQFTLCGPSCMFKHAGEFAGFFFLQVMFLFVGITILLL